MGVRWSVAHHSCPCRILGRQIGGARIRQFGDRKMERGEREEIITIVEKKDGIGNCAESWLPWVVRLAGARVAEEKNWWAGLNRQEDEV